MLAFVRFDNNIKFSVIMKIRLVTPTLLVSRHNVKGYFLSNIFAYINIGHQSLPKLQESPSFLSHWTQIDYEVRK